MELINKSDVINITAETGALETQLRVRQMPAIINIPDHATNGDVIKALFPNGSQVKGAGIYVMNDNKSNVFYDFDWWNISYKGGKE